MSAYLPGLVQALTATLFLVFAFRAHERFWTLGFIGWNKVYAGLGLWLLSGLLNFWFHWSETALTSMGLSPQGLGIVWATVSAVGLGLLLAGSIERLRDLALERRQLEETRSGFDLFDTLREVAAGPYSYLEVLDFSLKEIVRGAETATGGLWLFNPKNTEWILTGASNMSQSFRGQVESVRGSGTGFDRLARLHKAHLFTRPEEIRLFFPEWEAEGYRAVLGLPLVTSSPGRDERQLLGVIILADQSATRFDDDRPRRLHAAADFIAAVVAESRLHREIDGIRRKAAEADAAATRRSDELSNELRVLEEKRQSDREASDAKVQALIGVHEEQMRTEQAKAAEELRSAQEKSAEELAAAQSHAANELRVAVERSESELESLRSGFREESLRRDAEFQEALTEKKEAIEAVTRRFDEAVSAHADLEKTFADEKTRWTERLAEGEEKLSRSRTDSQEREAKLASHIERLERDIKRLGNELSDQHRIHDERYKALKARLDDERQATARDAERHQEEMQVLRDSHSVREQEWQKEREAERLQAADRDARYEEVIASERASRQEAIAKWAETEHELLAQISGLQEQIEELQALHAREAEELRRENREEAAQNRGRLRGLSDQLHSAQESIRDTVACLRERDTCDSALQRLLPRLPADTELYLWRRSVEGEPQLLRACGSNGPISIADEFMPSPWSFEADTIPAEGASHLDDPHLWAAMERGHDAMHCAQWDELWGSDRRPRWAVCWPWGAEGGAGENGWVTAFGFSETIPSTSRIEGLGVFAEIVGVVALRQETPTTDDHAVIATTQQNETLSDESELTDTLTDEAEEVAAAVADSDPIVQEDREETSPDIAELETLTEPSPDDVEPEVYAEYDSDDVEPEPHTEQDSDEASDGADAEHVSEGETSEPQAETIKGLHDALIAWVATQDSDAWRLELSASNTPGIEEHWLSEVLRRGRQSCRTNGGDKDEEFLLSTSSEHGQTTLRLVNTIALETSDLDELDFRSDDTLSPEGPDDQPSARAAGRWMMTGDRCFGLEVIFGDPVDSFAEEEESWEVPPTTSTPSMDVLLADDDPTMSELLIGMLETLGHRAVGASDMQDACLQFDSAPFDVVISNADMPQRAGISLAEWVKSHSPHVAVILVTEEGFEDPSLEGICDSLLRKPFRLDQLQECLESVATGELSSDGNEEDSDEEDVEEESAAWGLIE